jgi:hypothetical protein
MKCSELAGCPYEGLLGYDTARCGISHGLTKYLRSIEYVVYLLDLRVFRSRYPGADLTFFRKHLAFTCISEPWTADFPYRHGHAQRVPGGVAVVDSA